MTDLEEVMTRIRRIEAWLGIPYGEKTSTDSLAEFIPAHWNATARTRQTLGTSLEEVMSWKETLGYNARQVFGPHGAHCSQKTYDDMKSRCVEYADTTARFYGYEMVGSLNSFNVHVLEGVPDGYLQPCDCRKEPV